MIVAGKCPPETEELEATEKKGFENAELYLEKHHLDSFEESLSNCQNSDLNIASVHTPHVQIEEEEYLLKADKLAQELDAKLVFHSKKILHLAIPQVEELGLDSEPVFENQPGASLRHLKQTILDKNRKLTLDTAHFYMAEEEYLQQLEYLLTNYADQVQVIHLCDSKETEDGLSFGEGNLEMEKLAALINNSDFNGALVLEVMPDKQADALQKWREFNF